MILENLTCHSEFSLFLDLLSLEIILEMWSFHVGGEEVYIDFDISEVMFNSVCHIYILPGASFGE